MAIDRGRATWQETGGACATATTPSHTEAYTLHLHVSPPSDLGAPMPPIALKLAIPHNTLSTHLAILTRAGLLGSTRFGRSIVYRIDPDGIQQLLNHLIQDCCNGKPELCGPLLSSPPARRGTATA